MPEKMREHKANKTTKKLVLLKQRITVEATLTWKFFSFYKVRLVMYSIFLSYNTMGRYHRWIPWVDTMGQYYGWIPLTIPWVNSMCGYIPWVDEYHG